MTMPCRCISYNRPDLNPLADRPEVILPRPSWSSRERGICVDACIADAIRMLWAHGIITAGCCCGHNRMNPSVIVDERDHALLAIKLLKEQDGRDWHVQQWRLCTVHPDNSATAVPLI